MLELVTNLIDFFGFNSDVVLAIPLLPLALGGLGGLTGAIAGASDKRSRQEIEVDDPSAFESGMREEQKRLFEELSALGQATGLGAADVQAAVGSQREVADILQQLQQTSGLPSEQDITRSRELTSAFFAPEREALKQSFEQQGIAASRQAARLGREANDPILRNKLIQDETRQQALLSARETAEAQNLAFQLPGQRLQFAGQRADILGGIAGQAFSNRSSLLALGNQLSQQDRAFRLATATRTNIQEGSLGQALAGAFAGIGQGASAGAGLMKSFAQTNALNSLSTALGKGPGIGGPSVINQMSSAQAFPSFNPSFNAVQALQRPSLINTVPISLSSIPTSPSEAPFDILGQIRAAEESNRTGTRVQSMDLSAL